MDSQQAAIEKEKYGLNADQRIKELRLNAKESRGAGSDAQAEFSRELVNEMLAEHDPRVRAEILRLCAEFDNPSSRAICIGGLDDPDASAFLRDGQLDNLSQGEKKKKLEEQLR